MSGKVIDLDPSKRITKEALDRVKATIADIKEGDVENFILLYTNKEGGVVFDAIGIDWALLGIMQAYLEELRGEMLHGDRDDSDN